MNEDDVVLLKNIKGEDILEAAGILGKLKYNADEGNRLINFLAEAISQEAGTAVADDFEKEASSHNQFLTAGYYRDALRRHALNASTAAALKKFIEQVPEDVLSSLKFAELFPHCQVAVMHGTQKGLELMQAVSGLHEVDDGILKADASLVPLESMQKAQKILAKALKDWFAAMVSVLPAHCREQDLPLIKKMVFSLLLVLHAEASEALLETLTTGPIGDIFTVQSAVVKAFTGFAEDVDLPSGIDGKGPDRILRVIREFLFAVACRRIKRQNKAADTEAVRVEASALVQPDARKSMARLLMLFLNNLLRELPPEKDLRPRANVKGFDAEGFHADFVRDCIAKRFSFTIEHHGKVDNLLEREAAVGRGKKDLEFYEQQLQKMIDSGQEKQAKKWAPPEVRTSSSMTEKDLKAAQAFVMHGINDRDMRMAITAIASQDSLKLFEAFYGKEPATGVICEIADRQMAINVVPRRAEFFITAEVHNSRIQSLERHGDGEDSMEFNWVNFFQFEYSGRLQREKNASDPSGRRWRVCAVEVELMVPHLMAPADTSPAQ